MLENPATECLFLGGTADGNRLPVNSLEEAHHLQSQAPVINDPQALDDGDPRPETLAVVEIYQPVAVKHADEVETVFVLNALSDDGIQRHLTKHFGNEVRFTR